MLKLVRRSTLVGVLVGLCAIALTSGAALASHIPASPFSFPAPFVVNPSAAGEPQGPFPALHADFSYVGEIDQTATSGITSSFTENGFATISTYRFPNLFTVVTPTTSGLNLTYGLYMTFSATGDVAFNPSFTAVDGTFTSFSLEFWLDASQNTTATPPPPGTPDEDITLAGTGDDILVASTLGNGLVNGFGGFHISGGLLAGDFDVIIQVFAVGGYFTWPGGLPSAYLDLNGVFSTLTGPFGLPGSSFDDALNLGSGNISAAQIPEPSTLLLLGTGLGMVGLVLRRRSKRNA